MNQSTGPQTQLNVFLVEDNEDTRLMLAELLKSSGHQVHSASSVQAALREFPLHGSDVLLSDVGLRDGDGWELLRALRRAGWSPYAIAMSGYGTVDDVAASKAAGFQHHLVKPFDLDLLERLLADVHEQRMQQRVVPAQAPYPTPPEVEPH